MFIKDIIVTKEAEHHITKHKVKRKEVLEVLNNFKFIQRKKKRLLVYGKTNSGRILTIVLERREAGLYSLMTARDGTKSEKGLYRREVE
ncbi:MAG: hypothetical protein U9N01_05835 [Euryarchaeota archaeon]|nr:hypothetical protein [Euryarchaeota archaeon]